MSDKENGGPAFPLGANEYSGTGPELGMSLLDYFATHATEKDIEHQIRLMAPRNGFDEVMSNRVSRAAARFAHAEEMLKEREK